MDWSYDKWPSGEPYDWAGAGRGHTLYDSADYHVDLGCGKVKKGRIGIDRFASPGVNIVMDLNTLKVYALPDEVGGDAEAYSYHEDGFQNRGLPFEDGSIESVISHHALEHIGDGFIPLMDEVYRVLKPGGIFRAIVPLFPSWSSVVDPDHRRLFIADAESGQSTFDYLCGTPGDLPTNCWQASFSVPYSQARFEKLAQDISPISPPPEQWTPQDAREIRVALRAMK